MLIRFWASGVGMRAAAEEEGRAVSVRKREAEIREKRWEQVGRKAKRKRGERWMVRGRTRVEIKQERPLSEGETGERRKHIYIAEVPEKGRQRTWRRRERRSKDMSERERKDR